MIVTPRHLNTQPAPAHEARLVVLSPEALSLGKAGRTGRAYMRANDFLAGTMPSIDLSRYDFDKTKSRSEAHWNARPQ